MSNDIFHISQNFDPDLTSRHGLLRSAVSWKLLSKDKTNDAETYYQTDLTALRNNRVGFS